MQIGYVNEYGNEILLCCHYQTDQKKYWRECQDSFMVHALIYSSVMGTTLPHHILDACAVIFDFFCVHMNK